MAWGRDAGRKILRGYTAMDLQKRIDDYETRGRQISKIQTENKNGGRLCGTNGIEQKKTRLRLLKRAIRLAITTVFYSVHLQYNQPDSRLYEWN